MTTCLRNQSVFIAGIDLYKIPTHYCKILNVIEVHESATECNAVGSQVVNRRRIILDVSILLQIKGASSHSTVLCPVL